MDIFLAMQGMDLTNSETEVQVRYRHLPSLERLTQLTALNLADNAFVRVPSCLHKLKAISYLDLSLNNDLQVPPGLCLPLDYTLVLSCHLNAV